jgi:hypothetical protein
VNDFKVSGLKEAVNLIQGLDPEQVRTVSLTETGHPVMAEDGTIRPRLATLIITFEVQAPKEESPSSGLRQKLSYFL